MYKLIVVEDEPLMSDYISKSIKYNELDIQLCAVCYDGEQALETILHVNPDIVITDINMPKLTGLELITRVLSANENIKFIVVSGYNDFGLVKEAFKLGIKDYILKTEFTPNDINELLKNLLFRNNNKKKKDSDYEKLLLKEDELKNIIWGNKNFEQIKSKLNIHQKDLGIMVFKIINYDEIDIKDWDNDKENIKYAIRNIIDELLETKVFMEYFFSDYDEIVFIFCDNKRCLNDAIKFGEKAVEVLNQYLRFDIAASFDCDAENIGELKKLYKNALYGLKYSFVVGYNKIINFQFESSKLNEETIYDKELYIRFHNMVKNENFKQLQKEIYLHLVQSVHINQLADIHKLYENYNITLTQFFKKYGIDFEDNFKNIMEYRTLSEANNYFVSLVEQAKKYISSEGNIIATIQRYIDENYDKEISLQSIAKEFTIDYSHLSRKFTKNFKQGFTKYLNEIRIKKAVELMENSHLNLNEIADKVGFNNYETFSRVFHTMFNEWPRDYRNSREV